MGYSYSKEPPPPSTKKTPNQAPLVTALHYFKYLYIYAYCQCLWAFRLVFLCAYIVFYIVYCVLFACYEVTNRVGWRLLFNLINVQFNIIVIIYTFYTVFMAIVYRCYLLEHKKCFYQCLLVSVRWANSILYIYLWE